LPKQNGQKITSDSFSDRSIETTHIATDKLLVKYYKATNRQAVKVGFGGNQFHIRLDESAHHRGLSRGLGSSNLLDNLDFSLDLEVF